VARALTTKSVEAARAGDSRREIPDGGLPSLYLVVQPSGAKSWAVRYRVHGKPRKLTLGAYPLLGLADARDRARRALQQVDLGADPASTKVEAKRTERDKVRTLVDLYDKRHLAKLRSGDGARGFLDRSAVAAWGDRDVTTVTKRDVVELLDDMVDRGSPISANRTLAHLRAFFTWLRARDVIQVSPAEGVPMPSPVQSRDRVLTDDELRLLWQATGRLGQPFGPLYRFLLLTGARLREASNMTDREVSGALWTIPGTRAKNGQPHLVPLSTAALDVLAMVRRIKGAGYLFTANGTTPVSGFAKAKTRLDREMAAAAPEPIPAFVIHDLRRTAASGMARLGVAPHVVEAVLNHRSGTIKGVAAIYNRFDYADEKRAALEAWGRHVLAACVGRAGG
jgi:integrase